MNSLRAVLLGVGLGAVFGPILRLILDRGRGFEHTVNGRPATGWWFVVFAGLYVVFVWVGLILHPFLRLAGRRGCLFDGPPDHRGNTKMMIVDADSFRPWPDRKPKP